MQIEIIRDLKIFFLHFDRRDTSSDDIKFVKKGLVDATKGEWSVLLIPGGIPIETNQVIEQPYFFAIRNIEALRELPEKLSRAKPGSLITLTTREMQAMKDDGDVQMIPWPAPPTDNVNDFIWNISPGEYDETEDHSY